MVTVQTLMSEKGIEHSVVCLQSVVRYSRQPVTTSLTETTVAVHFVSTYRSQLFQMLDLQRDIDLEPISVRFTPARTCTAFDLLLSDVKARSLRLPIGRLLNAQ